MNRDEELDRLRAENRRLQEQVQRQEDELQHLRRANEDLREGLRLAISSLHAYQKQVAGLEEVITGLRERVNTLEQRQAKDSHNSSLPPSSDRFVRIPKSLRKQSGKRPGGQPGHEGRALLQIETPDAILVHRVEHCTHCQYDLSAAPARLVEKRQVIDLPTKRLWITEHQAEEKQCPACQNLTRASFPAEVRAPVQYGTGIQALATYLVTGQVVPYARTSQLLSDLFGVQLSAASITRFVGYCHEQLAAWETRLKAAVLGARVLHQDETGMRVGKEGWWVHVCATKHLTHYGANRSRGREGMDAIGITPLFEGISVHDGLPSYQGYRFS
ncbi:MAG TPA: transposase, partial [Ktedonobacteraceae bacterium]